MINVTIIPVLKDNYTYLLRSDNGQTAIVDPGEAGPVIEELERQGLTLDYVLNTHHHWDHTDGNAELIKHTGAKLVGPASETQRIEAMDILLDESSRFEFGGETVTILETPGHTSGHICFYFPESKLVFTGDTLFLMSCGRLFEGTAEEMWSSLTKVMSLPEDTLIYCGHEYTVSNAEFCLHVEPDNQDLIHRYEYVKDLRADGKPTMPATVEIEKKTNVMVRAGSAERFKEIRDLKDNF